MAWDTLYKPSSEGGLNPGGLSFLLPRGGSYSRVDILGQNDEVLDTLKRSTAGEEHGVKFYSSRPGASYGDNIKVRVDQGGGNYKYFNIPKGGARYEGTFSGDENLAESAGGGGYSGGMAPGQIGYGFFPADLTGLFPKPKNITNKNIGYTPAETPNYNFTDPMEFAKTYGDFNLDRINKNFNQAQDMALEQLDTELTGLEQFVPAASALKRRELSLDNLFNQQQRTQQVDTALPGVRGQLDAQAARAEAFAAGRAPDSITDRALELGIRSSAADRAIASGFGASSSVARKASDLMSAQQRIQLSQYGDQLLSSNINQKAGLLLAPTSYSDAGQQIKVNPEVGAGRLTSQNLSDLNQNTLINPTNALQSAVQQNQFQTSLEQQTNLFNAGNVFAKDQFNESNRLNVAQFNAGNINSFALSKFGYQAGLAGAIAGAAQTNSNTQVALDQQAQYNKIFQDNLAASQQAGTTASIAQAGGAAIAAAAPAIISGVSDLISSLSGGSGETTTSGTNMDMSPSEPNQTSIGGSSSLAPGVETVIPASNPVPSGYQAIGSAPTADGSAGTMIVPQAAMRAPIEQFSNDVGIPSSLANDPQQSVTRSLINSGSAVLRSSGISDQQLPGMQSIGYSSSGRPMFASTSLIQSANTSIGAQKVNTLEKILDPTGVISAEDSTALQKIAAISQDVALVSSLNQMKQSGDTKGFVNTILGRFQKPLVDNLTDNAQNKAGLHTAFSAYQLSQNWSQMSPAQKALGLASIGIQGFKFADGTDLASKNIINPSKGVPGLNVGQALNLFSAGINVYSLTKNWDQLNALQKVAMGTGTAAQIANTAKSFNLLGAGTGGAAVPGITKAALTQAGLKEAPQLGVGAVIGPAGTKLPAGYSSVATTASGEVVAVPTANAATTQGALSAGSLLGTAAGIAGVSLGANQVYEGWGSGGKKGAVNGVLGGSSMAAGLYALGATNPYLLAGVVATSVVGNMVKTGKSEAQGARDVVRDIFKSNGVIGKDYKVSLADGTSVDIGMDGHGGKHSARDTSKLVGKEAGRASKESGLNAWDIDYTNDLDYASGMGGIALSRLIAGGKGTNIDQLGGQLGNAAISNIGFGKDMTPENFTKMQANQRAIYSKAGIKSKSDAYQLANQAFAEGRINETDLVSMHQAFNMIYDNNGYQTASTLMNGRFRGVEVAHEITPPRVDSNPKIKMPPEKSEAPFKFDFSKAVPLVDTRGLSKDEVKRRNQAKYRNEGAIAT